jgi:hypothetical protein
MHCDQCEALMINGVFCHERGCPNSGSRWDGDTWVSQRDCFVCGYTVDADAECCVPGEEDAWHEAHEELWCTCGHSVEEHPRKKECEADDCPCIAYEPDDREESAKQYP